MTSVERLQSSDFESRRQAATLHLASLPESLLSFLGLVRLERYYDYVTVAETETVFLYRSKEQVLGVAVLSRAPETLMVRALKHDLAKVLWRALIVSTRSATAARRFARARSGSALPAAVQGVPEVVQLFISASSRGQGIGELLLKEVESCLRGESRFSYYVKTPATSENRALRFYKRLGFVEVADERVHGVRYLFLVKELSRS